MDLASLLIRLSWDIYHQKDLADYSEIKSWCYYTDQISDTEVALIKLHKGDAIIVFQGTDSATDNASNRQFSKTRCSEWPSVSVHKGFYEKWSTTKQKVIDFLLELPPRSQVVFTGHSLGGALALIGALASTQLVPTHIYNVVSFGAPRVGGSSLRNHIAHSQHNFKNSGHYINGNDVVPNLPPKYLFYCDVLPRIQLKPRTNWWGKYNYRSIQYFLGRGKNPDHNIHDYIARLN